MRGARSSTQASAAATSSRPASRSRTAAKDSAPGRRHSRRHRQGYGRGGGRRRHCGVDRSRPVGVAQRAAAFRQIGRLTRRAVCSGVGVDARCPLVGLVGTVSRRPAVSCPKLGRAKAVPTQPGSSTSRNATAQDAGAASGSKAGHCMLKAPGPGNIYRPPHRRGWPARCSDVQQWPRLAVTAQCHRRGFRPLGSDGKCSRASSSVTGARPVSTLPSCTSRAACSTRASVVGCSWPSLDSSRSCGNCGSGERWRDARVSPPVRCGLRNGKRADPGLSDALPIRTQARTEQASRPERPAARR